MFERLTDRARKVMALANHEAQRLNHELIGPEHLLLGLLEGSGIGVSVLKDLGLDLRNLRREVESRVQTGTAKVRVGLLAQHTAAKQVIEHAIEEARILNHTHVGSEHIMLGLVRDRGIAGQVLADSGVTLEAARWLLVQRLGNTVTGAAPLHRSGCPMCESIAKAAALPSCIATLDATHAILADNQGPRGWCTLILKDHREHMDDLSMEAQAIVFQDVSRMAAAIRAVFCDTGKGGCPPRINYECLGNLVPHVHWHVIPRHADDPDPTRTVWTWPEAQLRGTMTAEERADLILRLRAALE